MMMVATWADEAHTMVRVERDGAVLFVPADPGNLDFAALVDGGGEIGAYAAPPPPVPDSVSDRQFFQALALAGLISQAEALAAVQTGALPAPIAAIVDGLPDQFGARMLLSGATTFERAHPLTDALGGALGYSPAQTDELFRAAAAL
jgi:hypothetical protein